MSNNVIKIISASPIYIPNDISIRKGLVYLYKVFRAAEKIEHETYNLPRFIDPGSNFQLILCPKCDATINDNWWQKSMDASYKNGNLNVKVPCCNSTISLNDLKYDWPAGFAQFRFEITNPKRNIGLEELQELESILKTKLKIILAHY